MDRHGALPLRRPATGSAPKRPPSARDADGGDLSGLGYKARRIGLCVMIDARGQIADVQGFRTEPNLRVPHHPVEGATDFLWGQVGAVLGVQRDRRTVHGFRPAPASGHQFRVFHHLMLSQTSDRSLLAFLRFLDNWSPADLGFWPEIGDGLDRNLVFRFQYDGELLHERHCARLAWKRMLLRAEAHPDTIGAQS